MDEKENNNNLIVLSSVIILGLIIIIIGIILSISLGAKQIQFLEVVKNLFNNDTENTNAQIIRSIRAPRAIAAVLIGCFLASSGSIMQGITRNPIASPYIMGVTQGATLFVAIYMSIKPISSVTGRVLFALLGASISSILIFLFSLKKFNVDMTRMVLAGTALGTLFISFASMVALLSNNQKNLAFWVAGGLSSVGWESLRILIIVGIIGIPISIFIAPKITITSLGEEIAIGLGENPNKIRLQGLLVVVLLSGSAAAIGGNIGFAALIVPQIAKKIVGTDYKKVIPVSMILGSILLVYSDILARIITAPLEVPLGSITALIGVPFLIYLVRREN